jgi:hypothetical protein
MGKQWQKRDSIRTWGKSLCFSSIARKATYRNRLLRGLLMGNSRDAEKRIQTVSHRFAHGLLDGNDGSDAEPDSLNEEDAAVVEGDVDGAGISNKELIYHFYACKPASELRARQSLAVFELLSLGLPLLLHRRAWQSCERLG